MIPSVAAHGSQAGAIGSHDAPQHSFEYAVMRVVPRVDRQEFANAAVLLYCPAVDFLDIAVREDLTAVTALCPTADLAAIRMALAHVADTVAGSGRAGRPGAGDRFRWLAAPRSTILQPGPIHTGLTSDPPAELRRLGLSLLGSCQLPGSDARR